MKWNSLVGATPLDPDEITGLIPRHITTHSQLNEWEQNNILEAELWVVQHAWPIDLILEQSFIQQLHKKMFDKTWRWAGNFRKTDKNIGIDWHIITIQLKNTLEDVRYQIQNQSYAVDEIAARFHHRMVSIHSFANGNGRHARLLTDALLLSLKQSRFTWGRVNLVKNSQTRMQYIQALRAADKHNYEELLAFVKT